MPEHSGGSHEAGAQGQWWAFQGGRDSRAPRPEHTGFLLPPSTQPLTGDSLPSPLPFSAAQRRNRQRLWARRCKRGGPGKKPPEAAREGEPSSGLLPRERPKQLSSSPCSGQLHVHFAIFSMTLVLVLPDRNDTIFLHEEE